METMLTEIVFILDRSGSMAGLEQDTIGGFNAAIQKQKQTPGEALVTTVLFDSACQFLHDRLPIRQVPPMTEEEYWVRGCTALLDAVGKTICHISNIHKYARPEDRPRKTLFIITTDGMENASHIYSHDQISTMVHQKQEEGWEFLFFGANIDAAKEAATYGISPDRAVNYHPDPTGTAVIYGAMEYAIDQFRTQEDPLGDDWKLEAEEDFFCRSEEEL